MIANIKRFAGRLLCLAGTGLLINGAAQAQFQADYGGAGNEFGRTGVMQTTGGLWASTGEAPGCNGGTDIYVVVANYFPPGPFFARTYNIGGNDFGKDIDEVIEADGTLNYVVTGFTQDINNPTGSRNNVFVMKLDQFGNVLWCKTYAGSATISQDLIDEGYDIEVLSDRSMVIVGKSNSNHSTHDGAIMFRIDATGNVIIWGKQWDGTQSRSENFFTVTQALNGELVAGGSTSEGGDADVFMTRVSLATGLPVAGWPNRYGFGVGSNEGMRCLRECAVAPNTGRFIIAGNLGVGTSDALAMLINGNGTFASANRIAAGSWEEAMGVFEGSDGRFNMTGLVNGPANGFGGYDIYLQQLTNTLGNIWYRLHGGTGNDQGWSINTAVPYNGSPDPYTIIACGMKTIGVGNEQLYLTRVGHNGSVAPCPERTTTPTHTAVAPTVVAMPAPTNWGRKHDNSATYCEHETFNECLGPQFKTERKDEGDLSDGAMEGDAGRTPTTEQNAVSGVDVALDQAIALTAYPNPIKRGSVFNIGYTVASRGEAVIAVSDMAGKLVHNESRACEAGATELPINTTGWAAGTYVIQVKIGERAMTRRIIVIE